MAGFLTLIAILRPTAPSQYCIHTLWNQLLLHFSLDLSKTLLLCYRHGFASLMAKFFFFFFFLGQNGRIFNLARRGSTMGFHLLWHTIELAMSTCLCLLRWLIWFLCFRFDALTELGAFMQTEFLCVSVFPFWGGGPSVSLTLCCFVVYSTRQFVLCLNLVLFCFSVLLALR